MIDNTEGFRVKPISVFFSVTLRTVRFNDFPCNSLKNQKKSPFFRAP